MPPAPPRPALRATALRALLAILVALAGPALFPGTATAAPPWAPAASAAVRPGAMTFTDGAQCTANFVFTDAAGRVYLGQAAHCAGTGAATQTDGCQAGSLPLGTPVEVQGATRPGRLAYSSWLTMQARGERDPATCAYNDFALVALDAADVGRVNPTVPFWGGPTGLDTRGTAVGDTVLSYGNSSLRLGVSALSPKQGTSLGDAVGGWSHRVYTATPGIPGDSGSAFLGADGQALGVLATLALAPWAGSNGVGDLSRELGYAQAYGGIAGLGLALGTEPFRGPLP